MSARIKLKRAPRGADVPAKRPVKKAAKKVTTKVPPPDLEGLFLALWRKMGPPIDPVRQYRFDQDRKWVFDFAFPHRRVAVEIEGGIFQRKDGKPTGHRSITGIMRDMEKYNHAGWAGWRVIRFHVADLEKRPVQSIALVCGALDFSFEGL